MTGVSVGQAFNSFYTKLLLSNDGKYNQIVNLNQCEYYLYKNHKKYKYNIKNCIKNNMLIINDSFDLTLKRQCIREKEF